MEHPYPKLPRLCDYLRHYAKDQPELEALVLGSTRYSYAAFDEAVDKAGAAMKAAGVDPGDRVAMITTPRPEFAITLMACLRIGAIWVGVNPRYTWSEIDYILSDCQPKLLVSIVEDAASRDYCDILLKCRENFDGIKTIVSFPNQIRNLSISFEDFIASSAGCRNDHEQAQKRARPDREPAVIVYTSGTTGKPKGALLCNDNLIYAFDSVSRSFAGKEHARANMRALCNLPTNHIGCIAEIFGHALICGGAVVFCEKFEAEMSLHLIEQEKITLFGGVPLMLEQIFSHAGYAPAKLDSVAAIGWGGAPASRALVEKMSAAGAHLFTNYGLTEGGAICSATSPEPTMDELCDTVGFPDPDQEYRILTESGDEAAASETGEVYLRGRGVFLGYWNNPDATDAALDKNGWLRTGDLMTEREDGAWILAGRKSQMFKSGGYNVYPREIEACLEAREDVSAACVITVPDKDYFEVGHAFITLSGDHKLAEDDLRQFLRSRLAAYKIPKKIFILPEMPMLPIGKVDKTKLREHSLTQSGVVAL